MSLKLFRASEAEPRLVPTLSQTLEQLKKDKSVLPLWVKQTNSEVHKPQIKQHQIKPSFNGTYGKLIKIELDTYNTLAAQV